MNCFIVMQGETFEVEKMASVLRAPVTDRTGASYYAWDSMKMLQKDDLIFHYSKGAIVAVSTVAKKTEQTTYNELLHYVASVTYEVLERPLHIQSIFHEIRALLPEKYSPFQQDGSGNSGYLYPIQHQLAKIFIRHIKENVIDLLIQPTLLEETSSFTVTFLGKINGWELQLQKYENIRLRERHEKMLAVQQPTCAICQLNVPSLLQTPFAKPQSYCQLEEIQSEWNGFVLCHNHSDLYEQGLITIDAKGTLRVAHTLMDYQFSLGLYEGLRIPIHKEQRKYAKWHEKNIFLHDEL